MFSKGRSSISLEELHAKISDADIVSSFLGIKKIPCLINSPFRKDNKPSLGIYTRDGVRVYWTDFATKERGSIFDLLGKMWGCSSDAVVNKIFSELDDTANNKNKSNNKVNCLMGSSSHCTISKSDSILECKVREWRGYDIEYWKSYGVSLQWLKYADVYPISHKIIIKDGRRFVFSADKYAYVFVERKEGIITLKIYQPFNKNGYKWSNKHDKSVISLWTKIPESGERVAICSSLKDALCLWSNTGIPALAVQGEGYGISNTAINVLKSRFKSIFIIFDNDKAGLEDGEKLAKETGFINVVLPQFEGGKDLSDYFKKNGRDKFVNLLSSLLLEKNSSSY
ncbi:MAG: toprim domain-containing protein [Lachnospiraceae bacterium]|nr:toprim domain-containing protein [Lachnospiraceae bacterium]